MKLARISIQSRAKLNTTPTIYKEGCICKIPFSVGTAGPTRLKLFYLTPGCSDYCPVKNNKNVHETSSANLSNFLKLLGSKSKKVLERFELLVNNIFKSLIKRNDF